MTANDEILRMNIRHYEGLLRSVQDEHKRQQIEKLLAEVQAELQATSQRPSEPR